MSRRRFSSDHVFFSYLTLSGTSIVAILAGIVVVVGLQSRENINRTGITEFITGTTWDPVAGIFGALPAIYGTLLTSFVAIIIAIPLGFGSAIFISEFAPPKIGAVFSVFIDLLASIPSVVYGLFGLFTFAPFMREHVQPLLQGAFGNLPLFQGPPLGVGFLTAGIVLSIMILPIITSVSREVLKAVPTSEREAGIALGLTRFELVRGVLFPLSRSGLFGATILALGRALGETMAVTMVIGNRYEISSSLFAPGHTLSAVIANEFTEAGTPQYLSALAGLALILMGITLLVNVIARILVLRITGATR